MISYRLYSKTTFVTVNRQAIVFETKYTNYSKTTFVTVNRKKRRFINLLKANSKTTFVTVNLRGVTPKKRSVKKFKNNVCYC